MAWILQNIRALVTGALAVLLFASGLFVGGLYVRSQWDSEKLAAMVEASEMADTLAKRIQELEAQSDKDEAVIRGYRKRNPSGRLHLPPPACPGATGTGSSVQAPPGDKPLPERAQQAVDSYTAGVDALMLEADLTVNDCRVVVEWARSLNK